MKAKILYGVCGPYVQSPADDVVDLLAECHPDDPRIDRLVKAALAKDPDCIEALAAKATVDFDPGHPESLKLLRRAVLVGSRLRGPSGRPIPTSSGGCALGHDHTCGPSTNSARDARRPVTRRQRCACACHRIRQKVKWRLPRTDEHMGGASEQFLIRLDIRAPHAAMAFRQARTRS
jgi:hypothetical protein